MGKTLVIGASLKPYRYSYMALNNLVEHGEEVVAIGLREGTVSGVEILKGKPNFKDVETVTLYLNAQRQKEFYDYILDLKPKRVIFNPGTENYELAELLEENGIATENACTLVMLSTEQY